MDENNWNSLLIKSCIACVCFRVWGYVLILTLVQPFDAAVTILTQIAIPMIAATTIGLILWVYLFI